LSVHLNGAGAELNTLAGLVYFLTRYFMETVEDLYIEYLSQKELLRSTKARCLELQDKIASLVGNEKVQIKNSIFNLSLKVVPRPVWRIRDLFSNEQIGELIKNPKYQKITYNSLNIKKDIIDKVLVPEFEQKFKFNLIVDTLQSPNLTNNA